MNSLRKDDNASFPVPDTPNPPPSLLLSEEEDVFLQAAQGVLGNPAWEERPLRVIPDSAPNRLFCHQLSRTSSFPKLLKHNSPVSGVISRSRTPLSFVETTTSSFSASATNFDASLLTSGSTTTINTLPIDPESFFKDSIWTESSISNAIISSVKSDPSITETFMSSARSDAYIYLTRLGTSPSEQFPDVPTVTDGDLGSDYRQDMIKLFQKGYTIGPSICGGGSAVICKVYNPNLVKNIGNRELVVKVIKKNREGGLVTCDVFGRFIEGAEEDEEEEEEDWFLMEQRIKKEVEIWRTLDHPNILPLYDAMEFDSGFYLVMPYCHSGSLLDLLSREEKLGTGLRAQKLIRGIAEALLYLHETRHVIHGDIKLENILIDSSADGGEEKPVLCDFGFSRVEGEQMFQMSDDMLFGSLAYCSPERFNNQGITRASDAWALGIVAFAVVTGHLPFWHDYCPKLCQMIINYDGDLSMDGVSAQSPAYECIIQGLLQKDPASRWTIRQALESDWLSSI